MRTTDGHFFQKHTNDDINFVTKYLESNMNVLLEFSNYVLHYIDFALKIPLLAAKFIAVDDCRENKITHGYSWKQPQC